MVPHKALFSPDVPVPVTLTQVRGYRVWRQADRFIVGYTEDREAADRAVHIYRTSSPMRHSPSSIIRVDFPDGDVSYLNFSDFKRPLDEDVRQRALAKLTPEEQIVLGLKKPFT